MKTNTRQLIVFFTSMLGALILICAMNYWIDPSGKNSASDIYDLASQQQPNQTLIATKSFDQRQWVRGRLFHSDCPDILILGSSTIGLLSQSMFNRTVLNTWLTGPSIEDYEAIAQMLNENKCVPKQILIGMDPWFFNKMSVSDRWKSIHEYYSRYQFNDSKLKTWIWDISQDWSKFKDNLSFITTRESLNLLLSTDVHLNEKPDLISSSIKDICSGATSTPLLTESSYFREADGHYENCTQYLPKQDQVREISKTYLHRNMHNMSEWHELNHTVMDRFENLITKLKQSGSSIMIISPPYQPIAFEILMNDRIVKKNLNEMDQLIFKMTKNQGIKYLNYRNPKSIPCIESEFNDSHHSDEVCSRKIATLTQTNF